MTNQIINQEAASAIGNCVESSGSTLAWSAHDRSSAKEKKNLRNKNDTLRDRRNKQNEPGQVQKLRYSQFSSK